MDGGFRRHEILQIIARHGRPMTVREVMDAVGYKSPASAHSQLKKLTALGFLTPVKGYEITESGRVAADNGQPTRLHHEPRQRS